jgi:hypothetical protein
VKHITVCISVGVIIFVHSAIAQVSVLSAGEGKSSIVQELDDKTKWLSASSSDKTISFTRAPHSSSSLKRLVYGLFQITAGGKNSRFPDLKNGLTNFEIQGSGAVYWYIKKNRTFNFLYLMPIVRIGRVRTVVPPSTDLSMVLRNRTTLKRSVQVGFNSLSLRCFGLADAFFGVAFDMGYDDNTERLENLQFGVSKYAGVDPNGNPVFITTKTRDGYLDSEFRRGQFINSMVDIGYHFGRIEPVLHLRWDSYNGDGKKVYSSPGFGVYYTKAHVPTKVLFGVQAFIEDVTNINGEDESAFKRTKVALVTGFDL